MLRQTSKQMAKEICHDNISYVATQMTEFRRGAMSRQGIGIICRDKKLKSNTGRILRHIGLSCDIMKNRRQNLCRDKIFSCRDKIFSCRDTYYCNLEKPVETLYEEVLLRQGNECHDTERQGFWS